MQIKVQASIVLDVSFASNNMCCTPVGEESTNIARHPLVVEESTNSVRHPLVVEESTSSESPSLVVEESANSESLPLVVEESANSVRLEEKTVFDVILADFGMNKVNVIKTIREITGLGLKEAKDLVDNAPSIVASGVDKEKAEYIKYQLSNAGATVEILSISVRPHPVVE